MITDGCGGGRAGSPATPFATSADRARAQGARSPGPVGQRDRNDPALDASGAPVIGSSSAQRKVLRGFHADVDLAALGRSVQALVAVRIRPPARERIEAFRRFALALPETVGVFVVTGNEDFLIHVAVADALYGFVVDRLTQRPEVADVRTSVVYAHLQRHVIDPLPRP